MVILFAIAGLANLIWGLHALDDKSSFSEAGALYASLNTWGWISVIWGGLILLATGLLWANKEAGSGLGIMLSTISAVFWLFVLPIVPIYSLVAISVNMLVIYILATYGFDETA